MRINIATGPWFPVPAIEGGAMNRVWQGLAEVFAAKGHQVTIISRSHWQQPNQEVINGVNYIRKGGLPQSTNIKLDLLKDFYYALKTFPDLPVGDILIINDFWLPVFASLRKQVGKIVINANRFPKGQYWLYQKSDRIAAASQIIQETISQQCPAVTNRIKVIPNPISTDIFSPADSCCLSKSEKTILYVGRIHPEKGVHLLIEAFSLLSREFSQVKLKIIGPVKQELGGGGEAYFNSLQTKAFGLPIKFSPPIFDTDQLAQAYREADLFCYPSLAEKGESFGIAALEAMASGLVPIVSDLACFKDFIEEGKTGYFFNHRSPDSATNLANTFKVALTNWEQTLKIADNSLQKALNFNYIQVAKIYLADFVELVGYH